MRTHVIVCLHVHSVCVNVHTCIHAYIYLFGVCMHIYIYIYTHTHMCVYLCLFASDVSTHDELLELWLEDDDDELLLQLLLLLATLQMTPVPM